MTTKMTLSMEPSVVAKARRISKRRQTSISAMFSNYIASLEEEPSKDNELPPITKQILKMGAELPQVPSDWDYRDELSDSLSEKYGVK